MYWSQVRVLAGPPNIMIKLKNLNSTNLSLQLYFLIFSAIVIYIERDVYLAPFYFTNQESLPALQTYLSSLARTQKEEFSSIIDSNNGNFEALFKTLEEFIKN